MEVGRRNAVHPLRAEASELVLAAWRDLGSPQVGAAALQAIHHALRKSFDSPQALSPAAIARILADAGAELSHPEVIEFDVEWRTKIIQTDARKFEPLNRLITGEPVGLKEAESLMRRLEQLRPDAEDGVRALAIEGRQAAAARAESKSLPNNLRAEQREMAEWLRIWLETPDVFTQWLELRKSSPDFRQKFASG